MTAANINENSSRKVYLKVKYNGTTRKFEWNTSNGSFAEMETKVRQMFHLEQKHKLSFMYSDNIEYITMSSDEELSTALHFLDSGSDVLNVLVEIKKRHRNNFKKVMRTGKRVALEKLALLSRWRQLVGPMLLACLIELYHLPLWRNRKFLALLFLVLAYICIPFHSGVHHGHHRFHQRSHTTTILGATYGGVDVTRETQAHYNRHGVVQSNDGRYFGDGSKYFHVVWQQYDPVSGKLHYYCKGTSAGTRSVHLTSERPYPVEYQHGRIQLVSALYEDKDVTTSLKAYARAVGGMQYLDGFSVNRANLLNEQHYVHPYNHQHHHHHAYESRPGNGAFTMVYYMDGQLKIFTGQEGSRIQL